MNHALQAYNVMTSPTPNHTPQQFINSVHLHLLYLVAKAKQVQHGSLVDRGANGGLAGSDVRILSKSSRKCTVTGIDQHQINGLDIVQCAALDYTNHGYVNLIMNEYVKDTQNLDTLVFCFNSLTAVEASVLFGILLT